MRRAPLLLAALAACAPNPAAPVKVMAVVPASSGAYGPREVDLTTVDSITALRGKVATLLGGAKIVLDPADPLLAQNGGNPTEEQYIAILLKDQGGSVRANYVSKKNDKDQPVLWPADFHSWNMVTLYFNFEQAFSYFQQVFDGRSTAELENPKVLYWATFLDRSSGTEVEVKDNALFFSPVKSFLVVPFDQLQKVPLAMNTGVIGHEYAHLVFSKKVFSGAAIPAPIASWSLEPFNVLKSIDEGFSDFHGWGLTCAALGPGCRPAFLSESLGEVEGAKRDISLPTKCMTAELRNAINTLQQPQFLSGNQYQLGTLFAASMYQAAQKTGKVQVMQRALVASYDDDAPATPGFKQIINLNLQTQANFTLERAANTVVAHVTDPDLKRVLCNEFSDRLQLDCVAFPCDTMPDCPATSSKGTSCPVLPPENP